MSRFHALIELVARHQAMATQNYDLIRGLGERLRAGFCEYLAATDGECVHLVPAFGPFEPRGYGDDAFSMPPRGFRPIVPVAFGLAVRLTREGDWLRVPLHCAKEGERFRIDIANSASLSVSTPSAGEEDQAVFEALHAWLADTFTSQIDRFEDGVYGGRDIGFDMDAGSQAAAAASRSSSPPAALAP